MLQVFTPGNNPETPFNTRPRKKKKNSTHDTEAVYIAGTLQATYQKTARMWQIIALVSLSSFFISLFICFYAVTLPKTVPVIVTVNDEGEANYVGKVDKSYWGHTSIPENAKVHQIKVLIQNMNTWIIDGNAQQAYLDLCGSICQEPAITQLNEFILSNNPFNYLGILTKTVEIEEPMKQTNSTYVTYYNVLTFKKGVLQKKERFSILTTLSFFEGTPESNPLGIYISSFDIKAVNVN